MIDACESLRLQARGDYPLACVGESHYQNALEQICGASSARENPVLAHLCLEDTNPYDPEAVRVDVNGSTVGYLSRQDARAYRELMAAAGYADTLECRAVIRGRRAQDPSDHGYGIWLDVPLYNSVDPHGQPFNVRFNRARRAERDLSEFLGLAKGLLADGTVSQSEAELVRTWLTNHASAIDQWPLDRLTERVERIYRDGRIDDAERRELSDLLSAIVGGTAGIVLGEDAATELPLDVPPPVFKWPGSTFVLTGKFAFGTRAECERQVAKLGGVCNPDISRRTSYLIIGTFGSRDWIHTSFGRKIEKAVEYRTAGHAIAIVGEDYWVKCVENAA
ncbi:MAG TPA: HIRAN domain-containing protein [Gemmatimonadaceae bacterium]|nr:HIRAN domain-containing protein [Gemmatimonadaceae bacterium]